MAEIVDTPNADQSRYWNEAGGRRWIDGLAALDERLAAFGHAAMDAAVVASGEHVLDVGCGCGATSVELGRRVGAGGSVLAVDLSQPMLETARRRSEATHVRFERGDAQVYPFPPGRVRHLGGTARCTRAVGDALVRYQETNEAPASVHRFHPSG